MILIIVESPAKARTISQFLSRDYKVLSSFGHIRDLPERKIGIDVKSDFKPTYVILSKAKDKIRELKKYSPGAKDVILATDEDREGEAIAWHLTYALSLPKSKTKRIVFHEITKNAIEEALKNPRQIDQNLVDAQQARRILDRLVGFKLSPFLWWKVMKGLSAGRVQSVAVRLIVEREREIEKFKKEEYWTIIASLLKIKERGAKSKKENSEFQATLIKGGAKTIPKMGIKNKEEADKILKALDGAQYKVSNIEKKEVRKNPYAPFTTSSLQQTSFQKLHFTAKKTMLVAQQLYEGINIKEDSIGLITYMRTDSLNLSEESLKGAQKYIIEKFGKNYAPPSPVKYKTKAKGAQEAHEAIRPTDPFREPDSIKNYLSEEQYKLYNLIWRRFTASQMVPAIIDQTIVDVLAKSYTFRATGSIIKFDGFTKVYEISSEEVILPPLTREEILKLLKLEGNQHFTQPPPRYNDASLVKALESFGIGRPSTYAPIIDTIQQRGYVKKWREDKRFHPTEIGTLVNDVLCKHFSQIVDINFTAKMEENLDKIAEAKTPWVPVIKDFYEPFAQNLREKYKEVSKKELTTEETKEKCPDCGKSLIIRLGRFGKFYACTGYPQCKYTRNVEKSDSEIQPAEGEMTCDKCGASMVLRKSRYGKFWGCSKYPKCRNIIPIDKNKSRNKNNF
ncbi:MAG: DNA topoisomerase I [Parcubacteria group bacterium CG11_big_fil_rev_8_21_14_0_20_39_14]|nr:MAG: DNA topoisomerase I [Parcubacteria group bacterium CG11_big_fil_rev_8_21_14_0_20_39_14]PIS35616.1 MAG: type I DNA topoisomerase [Parcubacteria group bacterium CG08_land_8_20_14_0_20_38_56]